jgi:hypothetical protein
MTIGAAVTKPQLDNEMAQDVQTLRLAFRKIEERRLYFLTNPDAVFVAMGYTLAEVATVKSAWADGDTIRLAATAAGTIPVATNLMANLNQLAGTLVT